MKKAIFLDRDGVINHNIWNPSTQAYESPHFVQDFSFVSGVFETLQSLQNAGFLLFIVSNQPSFAKGKTTLENLKEIHECMHKQFLKNNILFTEYYYCYHHPAGIIPEYSRICSCRKPNSFFLKRAEAEHKLSLESSWMLGDRDTDIWCGKSAGTRTIRIKSIENTKVLQKCEADYFCQDLDEASGIILNPFSK